MFEPYAEVGRRRYPPRAIAAIAGAWTLSAALIITFAAASYVLLPFMPLFFIGPMFVIKWAHDYAHSVAGPEKPRLAPPDDYPIGSPYPTGSEPDTEANATV
jgi:hypothetical protein